MTIIYEGEQEMAYQVKNIVGQPITKGTLTNRSTTFDLSGQPAGLYILEYSREGVTYAKKIIKK